ncbi:aldehyde dehydrogenase [Trichodelitschia bisporula]|uniref:Succinate-semialdehyde dehydrogenase, mitochondrial n=1 Tax=Trichodelitschia bisporula TaxID=703511 RepID=A0A6G1I8C8_9PEZI|nr:aldehyde dehydrogenase [Trichodelitschia bisporula]
MAENFIKKSIPYTFKDPSLLDHRSFIGGKWVEASSGKTFPVYDPTDDQVAFSVADLSRDDTRAAVEAAHAAFLTYRHTPPRTRRALLNKWASLIRASTDDLAAICTLELGKPFTESIVTVNYGLSFLDWFEGGIERLGGETIPAARGDNRIVTIRQPQGVVAAITPWNSPIAMITRKVGAAIAAGNTVVCKPAPETPLCAIALAKLFERAGYPPGVFNVVTGSAESTPGIGAELCENRLVRHLSFTGSTPIGKFLNTECAKTMKRISMELGGNAPFLIFEDADIPKAVEGLITSKWRSSGQTCVCANRILVHESIIDQFKSQLQKRLGEVLVPGSVWDRKTNFGPLYSGKAVEKVKRHLEDATSNGAELITGGLPAPDEEGGPNFIPPTLLVQPPGSVEWDALAFSKEETFGPLATLLPFKDEKEAIEYANRTEAGLAAYLYTNDIGRMWRVAEALEAGMVGVRVGLVSACEMPFGGIKESGIGREGGGHCLEEYTEVKAITFGL